ncbi:MAG: ribosome-binding factor A [Acidimicrobiaceae bacterium]|nr:ribosome-binding factor A [Acidimicrobiaceae bacterium]MBN99555.1 ribosome-binding factor A [Acidimicrobiaceae bacterium]HAY52245.1 30S ribosome-binding factor RbfA [Acidimicrobiaceae bacterium]|tara:strand:- start:328 stop:705 length:378 start_codon:yes stop_codon:yes gene_type:complete
MARRRSNRTREYQRSARLNELLREIIAEELERVDDDRLDWVSVVSVEVDNELTKARVYLSSLEQNEDEIIKVLSEYRGRFRKVIGRSARIRRVPDLTFMIDPSIRTGNRIEEILTELDIAESEGE